MIRWGFEHVNLNNMIVINDPGSCIDSFQDKVLETMYELVRPKVDLTTECLERCIKTSTYFNEIGKWWILDREFMYRDNRAYRRHLMREPYRWSITMICGLYGTKDATHFKEDWVSLILKL